MKRFAFVTALIVMGMNTLFGQTVLFQEGFETLPLNMTNSGSASWARSSHIPATGFYCDTVSLAAVNDSAILMSNSFTATGQAYVLLEFKHICKMEFMDGGRIEISTNNGASWIQLTSAEYLGSGQFGSLSNKFNAVSYLDWLPANNSAQPQANWWRQEAFNISGIAANASNVKVRFIAKDLNSSGSAGNYGWLLDDIKVTGGISELIPPVLSIITPIIQDTVYYTGPFEIKANITDNTGIDTAYVVYTIGAVTDTVGMNLISGTLYQGNIPSQLYNTGVCYKVVAIDSAAAHNTTIWPASGCVSFYTKYGSQAHYIGSAGTSGFTCPLYIASAGSPMKYSRHISLFTPQELGKPGTIKELAWHKSNFGSYTKNNGDIKIYLKETSSTSVPTTVAAFTTELTGASTFYSSQTQNIAADTGWINFAGIGNGFTFSGNANVLVMVEWYRPDSASASLTWDYQTLSGKAHSFWGTTSGTTSSGSAGQRPIVRLKLERAIYAHDVSLFHIVRPVHPETSNSTVPFVVRLRNEGSNNLTSANIHWVLDGQTQPTFQWTGNLQTHMVSNDVQIGLLTLPNGPHTVKFWTSLPNNQTDNYPLDDTASIAFHNCSSSLNGSYTFGSTGADFTDFQSLKMTLYNCGITGPVNIKFLPGTYTLQMQLHDSIPGLSATNTITFTSSTANKDDVTITWFANGSADNYVVNLNTLQYITFEHLTLKTTNTSRGRVVWLTNSASNNIIRNCRIVSTWSNTWGSGTQDAPAVHISGMAKFNTIEGNEIINGNHGIWIQGTSGARCKGNILKNNRILGFWQYGIYTTYQDSVMISGNFLKSTKPVTSSSYTIQIDNASQGVQILRNTVQLEISGGGYGIRASSIDISGNNVIANNMITLHGPSTSGGNVVSGIFLENCAGVNVVHNSVNLATGGSVNGALTVQGSTTSGLKILNNSFAHTNFTWAFYIVSTATTAGAILESNYNNFYSNGTIIGRYGTTDIPKLGGIAALITASSKDSNSIITDPKYYSTLNLHSYSPVMNNAGKPTLNVTNDFDLQPRSTTVPDMGADEYAVSSIDIGILGVLAPLPIDTQDRIVSMAVLVKNFGTAPVSSYQLKYVLDNQSPVTASGSGALAIDEMDTVFIPNFSIPALNHNLQFNTVLAGDTLTYNDSISHQFFGAPRFDIQPLDLLSPLSDCNLGNETVKVRIRNNGVKPITSGLTLKYQANGSTPVSQQVTQTLGAKDSLIFSFSTPLNMSPLNGDSLFNLVIWSELIGDADTSNDTLSASVLSKDYLAMPVAADTTITYGDSAILHAISPYPVFWYSDPSASNQLFAGNNFQTPALFDTTTYYVQASTDNPSKSAILGTGTTTNGQYELPSPYAPGSRQQYLYLASELVGMGLHAGNIDTIGFFVDYAYSHSSTWELSIGHTAVSSMSSTFLTNFTTLYTGTINSNGGWTYHKLSTPFVWDGTSNIYIQVCVTGSNLFNPPMRYSPTSFVSSVGLSGMVPPPCSQSTGTTSLNRPNTYFATPGTNGCTSQIKAVTVTVPPPAHDAVLLKIMAPVSGCGLNSTPVKIRIKNNGYNPINGNLPVAYRIDNNTWVNTEIITDTIAPDDSLDYTFTTLAALPAGINDSTYTITAKVMLNPDNYVLNDQKVSGPIKSYYTPIAPSASGVTINYGNQATLNAISQDSVYWYNTPVSSVALHTGSVFQTPALFDTTTYYIESRYTIPSQYYTLGLGSQIGSSPTPYGSTQLGSRNQFLVRASELKALGWKAGIIESVSFKANGTASAMESYTLSIGTTSQTELTAFAGNLQTVFYSPVFNTGNAGFVEHVLNVPYYWDGESNIVIETCYKNPSTTTTAIQIFYDNLSFNASASVNGSSGFTCGVTAANTLYTLRPQIRFKFTNIGLCGSTRVPVTVTVINFPNIDAGIIDVVTPTGSQVNGVAIPAKVVLKNFGLSNLSSVVIKASQNGQPVLTYNWSGTLQNGGTDTVTIGNITPGGGTEKLVFWTENPNAQADLFPGNDKDSSLITSCFTGTYTAGKPTSRFPNLQSAINELTLIGMCGPVTLKVDSGFYAQTILIGEIPGISQSNNLIIESSLSDSSTVTFFGMTNIGQKYIFRLNNASYITIRHLGITAGGDEYANAISLNGTTHHIKIENCIIRSVHQLNQGVSDRSCGIISTDQQINNIEISNNNFYEGFYAVYTKGQGAGTQAIRNISVRNNKFTDFQYAAVMMYYADTCIVDKNLIRSNAFDANYSGIRFMYVTGPSVISNNSIVIEPTQGAYGIELSPANGAATGRISIFNNMITVLSSSLSARGIYASASSYVDVVYNSVYILAGDAASTCVRVQNGSNNRLLNNVLFMGTTGYIVYANTQAAFTALDHNAYYNQTGSTQYAWWGGAISSLANWQASDPSKNANSKHLNPLFYSAQNLHTQAVGLYAAGTPIAGITLDFDGDLRNATTPMIGADEFIPAPYDLGLVELVHPNASDCFYSSNDSVVVKIMNIGINTLNFSSTPATIQVSVSGITTATLTKVINSGSLLSGKDTLITVATNVNLNLHGGAYILTPSVTMSGDGNTTNNSLANLSIISYPSVSSFPFSDNFESGGLYTMKPSFGGSASAGVSPAAANASSYGLHFQGGTFASGWNGAANLTNAYNNVNNLSQTRICKIDASGLIALSMKFDLKMTVSSNSDFNSAWFRARVFDQWGNPYYVKDQYGDSVFKAATPAGDPFITHVFNLNSWAGQTFSLVFEAVCRYPQGGGSNGAGDNVFVDNFDLWQPSAKDVAVTQINVPGLAFGPVGTGKSATVRVENYGTVPVDSIPVTLFYNGLPVAYDTIYSIIQPNSADSIEFINAFILLAGQRNLCAATGLTGDIISGNDTLCRTVHGLQTFTATFADNFDTTDYWVADGQAKLWEKGVPSGTLINTPVSAPNVWATNLDGQYPQGVTEYLYSPYIIIPAYVDTAVLEFQMNMDVQTQHGYGRLQYSTNGGSVWVNLGFISSPGSQNWYNTNVGGIHSWSAATLGWLTASYPLPKATFNTGNPVQFRFLFASDAFQLTGEGWAIDNFKVTLTSLALDAKCDSLIAPVAPTVTGDSITVSARFRNIGTSTLANLPVGYKLSNGFVVNEVIPGPLAPGAQVTHTFSSKYFAPGNSYSICTFSALSSDMFKANDTLCASIPALPGLYDAGVTRIVTPGTSSWGSTVVSVRVRNFGSSTLISIPVFYKVGASAAVQETWIGSLNPGDSVLHTFTTPYNSPLGIFSLCAGTELSNDVYPPNDDICKSLSGTSSIGDNQQAKWMLTLYPNPSSDRATLEFNSTDVGIAQIILIDLLGRTVMADSQDITTGTNSIGINTSQLSSGIYTIILQIGTQSARIKLVKE